MIFKIKHIRNLLIRFITKDNYYVCEECHRIHKRDGKEVRLDGDRSILKSYYLWYGSVSEECFIRQQRKVFSILANSINNN